MSKEKDMMAKAEAQLPEDLEVLKGEVVLT